MRPYTSSVATRQNVRDALAAPSHQTISDRLGFRGSAHDNGLRELAGSWSTEDFAEFEDAIAFLQEVTTFTEGSPQVPDQGS